MCLILFSYQPNSKQRLTLAANRDEFHQRPTNSARRWPNKPSIIAGQDLQAHGTWLGVTKRGRFAAITNYRSPNSEIGTVSRGTLCADFLASNSSAKDYLTTVQANKDLYSGFNLLVDDGSDFYYYSNIQNKVSKLSPGVYGLSNAFLNTDWPKTSSGTQALKQCTTTAALFTLLADKTAPADDKLPDTGAGIELEKLLAPRFIQSETYGTRASTIVTIKDVITLHERGFNANGDISHDIKFRLGKPNMD